MSNKLARIGRRVAAIVAECNYAQTRLTSLRNTPHPHLTQRQRRGAALG
jgi:hypothetical protein